jgi:hypothetical protein
MGTGYASAIGAQIGQSTPSTQALYGMAGGKARRKVKRARKSVKRSRGKSVARKAPKRRSKARLVKGSRAAKAYMAKIRRKRRK